MTMGPVGGKRGHPHPRPRDSYPPHIAGQERERVEPADTSIVLPRQQPVECNRSGGCSSHSASTESCWRMPGSH
jgi:hypothetical protein